MGAHALVPDRGAPRRRGAAAAKAAASLSDGEHADAERVQLAMLELISRCACDDLEAAVVLLRRIQWRESVTSTRRAPTVALSQGLLHHARGELSEARAALHQAHQYLSTHSDLCPRPSPAITSG